MPKQGSIKHYRQSGAQKTPESLPFGEIAIAKDGTLFAGDAQNIPQQQYARANILDNSNFANAVNQRGASGTISTPGYFLDRWKLTAGTVTLTTAGMILNGTIVQILASAIGASFTASSNAGAASYNDTARTFTLTATGQTITWTKLEKGSMATPYVPKGYGAEMIECMRYYQKHDIGVYAWPRNAAESNIVYKFPIAMRINPTMTFGNSHPAITAFVADTEGFTVFYNTQYASLDNWKASADL